MKKLTITKRGRIGYAIGGALFVVGLVMMFTGHEVLGRQLAGGGTAGALLTAAGEGHLTRWGRKPKL